MTASPWGPIPSCRSASAGGSPARFGRRSGRERRAAGGAGGARRRRPAAPQALGAALPVRRRGGCRIVERARVGPESVVLEIGPGLGALTDELAARAGRLYLIEVDRGLAARLAARYATSRT